MTAQTNNRKVIIDELTFDGPIHASPAVVDEVLEQAKQLEFDANSGWLNEFAEATIRDTWQRYGYFRANATLKAELLGGDSNKQHFRVIVHLDEGLQYHLGAIRFEDFPAWSARGDADPFSVTELRELVPMEEGEIFDVSKVRKEIDLLNKKFTAIGFIDFTAVPETEIDDKLQRISLTLSLDKQKQYRIGEVEVAGLDAPLEGLLTSKLVPGDTFNPAAIDDFVRTNRPSLPNLKRGYLNAKRNMRLGTVDLYFDFRPLNSRDCREETAESAVNSR